MKKLSTFIFCLLALGTLVAQVRLDVEGDAKIRGKLDLKAGTTSLFIGENAGMLDNGENNTFVGTRAGKANTEGSFNSFFGYHAGFNNISGRANAFFGNGSGDSNTSGKFNSFFGLNSGFNNTTGSENAFFGYHAGDTDNNTRSTLLGFETKTTDSLNQAIAIGYKARVACHSCAVIGGTEGDAVKVGIGTTTPVNPLHIVQQNAGDGNRGIRLEYHDNSRHWTTYGDASGNYNFTYNGGYMAYITPDGSYVDASSFTGPNTGSESRNRQIQTMDNVLAKVKKLQPATKNLTNTQARQEAWGFDAEAVSKLFPAITPEKNGQKGIIYDYFGILSIKAIQELAVDFDIQKTENNTQNETITNLENQVTELRSLVETLLTQNAITPKSTSYVLPLEQKALLAQNQPNPFRENTLVDYFVPAAVQHAHIQVTNMDGQVLGQVTISEKGKGQVTIQSKSYPAGTYFYSLVLDGQVMETKRMVLAR